MSAERILIVEDSPTLRDLLQANLEAYGYHVVGAATIAEAMNATRTAVPDLMILDLTVLDEDPFSGLSDGFAFLSLFERSHPEADFPVVIHTGNPSPEVKARAQAHGVYAVIQKGISIKELVCIVRLALEEWALKRAGSASPTPESPLQAV
jgi:CheY-like chemotaxis protein